MRAQTTEIRYVALGDSYTIGTGTTPDRSWPAVLTRHLQSQGLNIRLVANPAQAGWTTQEAILRELPVFEESDPNFATLMIGVNDWVQGMNPGVFRNNFAFLLDEMVRVLGRPDRLLVVNIPDFSYMPSGKVFSGGRDISQGIADFNSIIAQETARRGIKVVDIFSGSAQSASNPLYISSDGLHPSAEGYVLWENMIYPAVAGMLLDK